MYKEKISRYIDAHRKEMLEDIGALCRINSVKVLPYRKTLWGRVLRGAAYSSAYCGMLRFCHQQL